jgi:hypothetical protein
MIRTLLVAAFVVLVVLALVGMRAGWRNRLARQQAVLPPLPAVPHELGALVLEPLTGLYVGSTFAASWQDRVVHGGLGTRANATATLHHAGLVIERDGAAQVFIPAHAIAGARLAAGLAGAVVGAGGLLVVQWRVGDQLIDTALRADDKSSYPQWVRALESVAAEGAARD